MRPPENRDPFVDEIGAYWPVLEGELARVDPFVGVPMSSFATVEILETDETIESALGAALEDA